LSQELSRRLDPETLSVPEARHFVRDVLSVWDINGDLATTVELLTAELVTNAILYGTPPIDVDIGWYD